jgi:hypothetical protein
LRTAASVLENGRNFSRARDVTGEVWKCQSGLDRRKMAEEKAAVKKQRRKKRGGKKIRRNRRETSTALSIYRLSSYRLFLLRPDNLTLSLVPE